MPSIAVICLCWCAISVAEPASSSTQSVAREPDDKVLLWGDTHLHTSNSFDAFLNGNLSADPNTAYNYAKGLPVIHPYNRTRVQIQTPLDFLVVSDHAEFFGGIKDIYTKGIQDPDPNVFERAAYWYQENQIRDAIDTETGPSFFSGLLPLWQDPIEAAKVWRAANQAVPGAKVSAQNAWIRMLDTATKHNKPGEFSTIIGWEWSSIPGGANLHRVVVTDATPDQARDFLPFASTDSPYPDDLWRWMEETGERIGANFLAIPHNPNISRGLMFGETTLRGEPMDLAYAQLSRKYEPVAEVTQYKGDSETHPSVSPDDDFADFETYPWYIQRDRSTQYMPATGDFARSGLKNGLSLQARLGLNPYQFGMIGSTDSHTGLAAAEEPNFWGKMAFDSIPERKQGAALAVGPTGWSMQAGGLAAVWAEENTPRAILEAFSRREVYATTGPRIRLSFYAGTPEKNTPMGGTISEPASFTVVAQKDPKSANLDRIQVVKGWIDEQGDTHEKIYNIAWAGKRELTNGKLPPIGSTVNEATGAWDNSIGAPELQANWTDPDFKASENAFYYVRVLEIPTPRHALLDAIAMGLEEPTEGPKIIQERAYSSPIWYQSGI
ncbi:MAG: DUF3604 domain-containing protein [Pseudomonadota bacterium]